MKEERPPEMEQHAYDAEFYRYLQQGASASARAFSSLICRDFDIGSVLDVGCGQGAWLAGWKEAGVQTVLGVDGDYVEREALLVQPDEFRAMDISQPFALDQSFDLVQSLEVAEHLPAKSAEGFVQSLCQHGRLVLFSAAQPGQGGEYHINEQPLEYWRALFAKHGFEPCDYIRPLVVEQSAVQPWYRYNTLLYAHRSVIDTLPRTVRETQVPTSVKLPQGGSFMWRARRALLAPLPSSLVTQLARLNTRLANVAKSRERAGTR